MTMTHKNISITLGDDMRFHACIRGQERSFDTYAAAVWAIDQKPTPTWEHVVRGCIVAVFLLGLIAITFCPQTHGTGALVVGQCKIKPPAATTPEPKLRTVADMGVGESACVGTVLVDKEHRAYLFLASSIFPVPPRQTGDTCTHTVRREPSGYYVTCDNPLNDPVDWSAAANRDFAPVAGFR